MPPLSLYIHIPFCECKCPYCDFYSTAFSAVKADEYTDRLCSLIKKKSELYNRKLKTIYFGGGTPSVLGTDRLTRIMNEIKNDFQLIENCEITLEVNPNTSPLLDYSKLYLSGFNRLSVGLQSSDNFELNTLGRRHTRKDVESTVTNARENGFSNISLDIMIAIPHQTKYSLFKSIEFCKAQKVEHISSYILKYERNTPFYNKYKELQNFSDDDQADFYEFTVEMCESLGYSQYEISNFSFPGYESKHNLTYWHDEEYLGLGPSAHSFINNKRFFYPKSFADFYNDNTVYESDGGSKEEYIMLALRLNEGLIFSNYENRFKENISNDILEKAKVLNQNGLAVSDNKMIKLTTKGMLISNSIITFLLD